MEKIREYRLNWSEFVPRYEWLLVNHIGCTRVQIDAALNTFEETVFLANSLNQDPVAIIVDKITPHVFHMEIFTREGGRFWHTAKRTESPGRVIASYDPKDTRFLIQYARPEGESHENF